MIYYCHCYRLIIGHGEQLICLSNTGDPPAARVRRQPRRHQLRQAHRAHDRRGAETLHDAGLLADGGRPAEPAGEEEEEEEEEDDPRMGGQWRKTPR